MFNCFIHWEKEKNTRYKKCRAKIRYPFQIVLLNSINFEQFLSSNQLKRDLSQILNVNCH